MGFIRVLIGVLVVLVGVLMLSAVLRARGHAVASLVRPLVVEILLRRHQVASFVGSGVVARVVALSHSLALLVLRKHSGRRETDRERPQGGKMASISPEVNYLLGVFSNNSHDISLVFLFFVF